MVVIICMHYSGSGFDTIAASLFCSQLVGYVVVDKNMATGQWSLLGDGPVKRRIRFRSVVFMYVKITG